MLQVAGGLWQIHVREKEVEDLEVTRSSSSFSLPSRFAALEATKVVIALIILLWHRRRRRVEQEWKREHRRSATEELPLTETNGIGNGNGNSREVDHHEPMGTSLSAFRGSTRGPALQMGTPASYMSILGVAVILATKSYFVSQPMGVLRTKLLTKRSSFAKTLSIYESDVINPQNVYVSASIMPLLSAAIVFLLTRQLLSAQQWVGVVLQVGMSRDN